MNYILQINAFWERSTDGEHALKPTSKLIYFSLLSINNRCGWKQYFKAVMSDIIELTGIGSKNTYYDCLDELQDKGFIEYEKGNRHFSATFKLIVLYQNLGLDNTLTDLSKLTDIDLTEYILKLLKLLNNKDLSIDEINELNKQKDILFKEQTKRSKPKGAEPKPKGEPVNEYEGISEEGIKTWEAFKKWITGKNYTRVQSLPKPLTPQDFCRLLDNKKYTKDLIRETFVKMENYKPLATKNVSAYLTLINWMDRELNKAA
jgi:hypothetical protein